MAKLETGMVQKKQRRKVESGGFRCGFIVNIAGRIKSHLNN
jgi:hypothetical protein